MRHDKAIKYLRQASFFAGEFSKDRSTKVGNLFLDPDDFTILSAGYNGQPRGCRDDLAERHERPLKYEYSEHGERNGIFNCVRPLLKRSSMVTTETLTMSSVRAAISVGVSEVWSPRPEQPAEQHERAIALLNEVRVRHGYHDRVNLLGLTEKSAHVEALYSGLEEALKMERSARDPRAAATAFVTPTSIKPLAKGVSDLPLGIRAEPCRWHGEERLYYVEDSVRNTIYAAANRILYGSIAVSTEEPCAECLRAIAAVGSREVVTTEPSQEFEVRWKEQYQRSRAIADELGLTIIRLPRDALFSALPLAA